MGACYGIKTDKNYMFGLNMPMSRKYWRLSFLNFHFGIFQLSHLGLAYIYMITFLKLNTTIKPML